jgi:hypothetical protein
MENQAMSNPTSVQTRVSSADAKALVAAERAKRANRKPKDGKPALAPKVEAAAPAPVKVPKPTLQALQIRKNGLMSARGLTCLCGCGAPTHTADARFLSGHDAIMRRNVLLKGEPVPAIIRPFFEAGEVIAGMRLIEQEDGTMQIEDVKQGAAGMMAVYAGI